MEASNVQKMREALLFVKQYFDKIDPFNPNTYTFAQIEVDHIQDAISAAFSAPPRNCDVGTAEEQIRRFRIFCDDHYRENGGTDVCRDCSLWTSGLIGSDCELKWAQMPYEEEGRNAGDDQD